ncbi:MAG: cupin domain-containing protein [Candidatus Binatia bacterium]
MSLVVQNIFTSARVAGSAEDFLTLFENGSVKIERIVSNRQSSPPDFWYDQPGDEWVIVLRGSATLEFFDGEPMDLRTGDYLQIARHVRHRVARTGDETIWLAVHLK